MTYVAELQALVAALTALGAADAVVCKRFFNGAAAYADGQIFMTLTPVGLALKLPEAERTALLAHGGSPLRYFPKAPIKRAYVVLPQELAGDPAALAPLVAASVAYVTGGSP